MDSDLVMDAFKEVVFREARRRTIEELGLNTAKKRRIYKWDHREEWDYRLINNAKQVAREALGVK